MAAARSRRAGAAAAPVAGADAEPPAVWGDDEVFDYIVEVPELEHLIAMHPSLRSAVPVFSVRSVVQPLGAAPRCRGATVSPPSPSRAAGP